MAALRAGTSDAMTASLKAELEAVKARLAQEERRQQRWRRAAAHFGLPL